MVKRERPTDGHTPHGYTRYLAEDGSHPTVGTGSHKLSSYELPVCETDKERRSFPGWNVYKFGPALMDAVSMEGTTETRGGVKTNKSHAYAAGQLPRRFE
jgi:hypothetical protein